jgi:hypothetical protein
MSRVKREMKQKNLDILSTVLTHLHHRFGVFVLYSANVLVATLAIGGAEKV